MKHNSSKQNSTMNRAGRMAVRAAVCLAAFIGMALPAAAQDDNRTLSVSVGELEYTVKEQPTSKTGKVVFGLRKHNLACQRTLLALGIEIWKKSHGDLANFVKRLAKFRLFRK